MDARPRTALFIINGIVPLTFVSGLPPSIRFGLSMKNEGVSVRFDGMSRLKRATPLRRVNEIKWNAEDLRDSEDMYMNGMRSSVLTVQTQMPSLDFTDPSHFRVEDNRIACSGVTTKQNGQQIEPTWSSFFLSEPISEGIMAISFTYLMEQNRSEPFFFDLIDGMTSNPDRGDPLGEAWDSIALSSDGQLRFLTENGQKRIEVSSSFDCGEPFVVEINMDSNPRTAQFFVNGESVNAVVVGLPESVRVGFSAKDRGMVVRFDRITNLNRGSPFTNQMKEIEWPTAEPLQATELTNVSDGNDEEGMTEEEMKKKDQLDKGRIDDSASEEEAKDEDRAEDDEQPSEVVRVEAEDKADEKKEDEGRDGDEVIEHHSEQLMENARNEKESDEDSENDSKEMEDEDSETEEGKSLFNSDQNCEDVEAGVKTQKRQFQTMKLPELLFTHKSHFIVRNNVLTRTEKGTDEKGRIRPSTVLLSEPITKGVVSVTFVVLNLPEGDEDEEGFINFGLLDSSLGVPPLGESLGKNVKPSIGISSTLDPFGGTSSGLIHFFNQIKLEERCFYQLSTKDRLVMEVNMDSTPRTVQFFVNGKAGDYYVSGIPESVRIGFSADVTGTSLQIVSIVHSTQPTPLAPKIKEIRWTDTKESLKERKENQSKPIRREAEGSMPALLSRNPEHFKIEGNMITRTVFDFDELNSPFSTVMLDGVVEKSIRSVTVTILALPETEHSCGVVMVGSMYTGHHIPKSPKGLGLRKKSSFALCSLDGMLYKTDWRKSSFQPCHSPLRVGNQVVLEVDTRSEPDISRFFVNGKAGQNEISDFSEKLMFGFSLAGVGTSIRIDAVTELDTPFQNVPNLADNTKTIESDDIDEAPKLDEAAKLAKKMNDDDLHATMVEAKQQSQNDLDERNGETLPQEPACPTAKDQSSTQQNPSDPNQPATIHKPKPNKSTPQPSAQKTDSVHSSPTAASSSTSKVPLKPQPLAAKVAARDHPAYEPFFVKLKSGKKAVFMAPEMREKGLDPAALSDPDMLV